MSWQHPEFPSPGRAARLIASISGLLWTTATAAGIPVPPPCVAAPAGQFAWWPGDRDFDDRAGFFNGSPFGSDVQFTAGKVGEAMGFDGNGEVITTATVAEERALRGSFSITLWARPTAATPACAESNSGTCVGAQRFAIFPEQGDFLAPPEETGLGAGIGLVIGNNAVCVAEHAPSLVDCLARIDTPITDWTHIAVVVENKQPRIYLNGALVRTGLVSSKSFVFASWRALGTGFGLGLYSGDLDEIAFYDRALGAGEIAALAAADGSGQCKPACAATSTSDLWDVAQGAQVTATTGVLQGFAAPDAFGASLGIFEPGALIFKDEQPDGFTHSVEWSTTAPVIADRLRLYAFQDEIATVQRSFRNVRIQARDLQSNAFVTLYDTVIAVPYQLASRDLNRCANLRPMLAQQFRAEFVQNGGGSFPGPRVVEIDGYNFNDLFRDSFE